MTTVGGFVKQVGRALFKDDASGQLAQLRDGSLNTSEISSLVQSWTRAGKVFGAQFATEGGSATLENNTALDLTEPFYRMAVKSGKVIVPISVYIAGALVWDTGDEWLIGAYDTDAGAAGGATPDIRNLAIATAGAAVGDNDNGVSDPLDGDSPITEGATTNLRVLKTGHFLTGGLHLPLEYSILKGDDLTMIEGSSVFGVWLARTTTTLEVFYSVKWAALEADELT